MSLKFELSLEQVAQSIPLMTQEEQAFLRRILGVTLPIRIDDDARQYAREGFQNLTHRERDVLNGIVSGASNKVIAMNFGISHRTVEVHRARIMQKVGARNVVELCNLVGMLGSQDG